MATDSAAATVRRTRHAVALALLPGGVVLGFGLAGVAFPGWWEREIGAGLGGGSFAVMGGVIILLWASAVLTMAYLRQDVHPTTVLTPGLPEGGRPVDAGGGSNRAGSDPSRSGESGDATDAPGAIGRLAAIARGDDPGGRGSSDRQPRAAAGRRREEAADDPPPAGTDGDATTAAGSGGEGGDRPRIAVLSGGGPVAGSVVGEDESPAAAGRALADRVPGLDEHVDPVARTVTPRPGFDARWTDVLGLADAAREAVVPSSSGTGDGAAAAATAAADGVVVVDGVDGLAETAYALDLLTDLPVPVICTGVSRPPDDPGSDAAANLLTAARGAADARFADGVHVAFDGEFHAARDVERVQAGARASFGSPGAGPVASVSRRGLRQFREPARGTDAPPLALGAADADAVPTVPVIHSGTGVGADGFERALAAGAAGVVVSAAGGGNVTGPLGDAIAAAAPGTPVVVAARPGAGPAEAVRGGPGGAARLAEAGALLAGDLPPAKARVALVLGLAAGRDREGIRALLGRAERPV